MSARRKAILDRIEHFEDAIAKGRDYLESGEHAHWHGFRPLFDRRVSDGKPLPPHKAWVRNVFLPRTQRALEEARKALERIERAAGRSTGTE